MRTMGRKHHLYVNKYEIKGGGGSYCEMKSFLDGGIRSGGKHNSPIFRSVGANE